MEDTNVQKPRGEMICEIKYEKLLFDLRLQTDISAVHQRTFSSIPRDTFMFEFATRCF